MARPAALGGAALLVGLLLWRSRAAARARATAGAAAAARARAAATRVELRVEGMSCAGSCGAAVQRALAAAPGVLVAGVAFERKAATVLLEEGAEAGPLLAAVEAAGFDARVTKQVPRAGLGSSQLNVEGESALVRVCAHVAWR